MGKKLVLPLNNRAKAQNDFQALVTQDYVLFVVLGDTKEADELAIAAEGQSASDIEWRITVRAKDADAIAAVKEEIGKLGDPTRKWKEAVLNNEALAFILSYHDEICDGFPLNASYDNYRLQNAWQNAGGPIWGVWEPLRKVMGYFRGKVG